MNLTTSLLIFLIGLTTGFFDATVGAGGLISIPALIFLGFPPQVAIATDRFGSVGERISVFAKFFKTKKIVWDYVLILSIISLLGSIIGANILLNIDFTSLKSSIGILLIILLPLVLLKRNFGIQKKQVGRPKKIFGFVIYFFIMIFGGLFAQGTGPLIFYTLAYFFGFTMIEVLATSVIPGFILSLSSLIIFALNGIVDWKNGIFLLIGMTIGGYLGAHIALIKGNEWIKRLFVVIIIISAIKLLFF